MLAVRGGTIGCAWWHYYLCVVALLSVRGGTMKADLGVFRFFYLTGLARNCVLSFFVPVDYESDGHKGERNNDGAGGVEKGPERLTLLSACCV